MSEPVSRLINLLLKNNKEPLRPALKELFRADPDRFTNFSRGFGGLFYDFSRTHLDRQRLNDLLALCEAAGLDVWRAALFAGKPVNRSEARAADHALLRHPDPAGCDHPRGAEVARQRREMLVLGTALRQGRTPAGGVEVRDVIHLGIGGSLVGPQLVDEALQALPASPVRVHFLSSVDGWQLSRLLAELDPRTTVVVATSKSFTTREVLLNLRSLKDWLGQALAPEALEARLFAVTANPRKAVAEGFRESRILTFPTTVCGRFSLWSAVGLPVVVRYGEEVYHQLLAGAAQMDRHFQTAGASDNLPVLAALTGIWHRNVCDFRALAVAPYDSRLRLLPQWLQQLDMESAGKSVDREGNALGHATAPVVFGNSGTDAQHTFFQALYQGSDIVPVDFIGVLENCPDMDCRGARFQIANLVGQADALAFPEKEGQVGDGHRGFSANRPSTVLLLKRLDPASLGQLLAFHEHRVFAQSVIWGNNPFDQFGVEFGKRLAARLENQFGEGASLAGEGDARSLRAYIHRYMPPE